ncbi:MAG TPA: PAS domain S-box protein [Gemmatimonadaceae bacterium]|nr:PAS domain S-box protein [Gemmatimonadaceae bacterium]
MMHDLDAGTRLEFLVVAEEQERAQHLAELLRRLPSAAGRQPSVSIAVGTVHSLAVEHTDVVFIDATPATGPWLETIRQLTTTAPTVPIVAVLPTDDDERCADAMATGASTCVALDRLDPERLHEMVRCAVAIGRAASAHEHAEAALREQLDEARQRVRTLDAIERAGRMGTWSWDVATDALEWSPGLYRILDVDPQQPLPAPLAFSSLVDPEDREPIDRMIETLFADRRSKVQRITYHVTTHTGEIRTIDATTGVERYAEDGRPALIVGVAQDVTERAGLDEALRASEEMFRNAMTSAPFGMGLVNAEGRWLRVNRAFCDMLGYTEDELLRMTISDVTHPDDLPEDLEGLRRMFAGEISSFAMEKRYRHKSGRSVWSLLTRSAVHDAHGRTVYAISQVQDLTERKRAREASEFVAEASQVLASSLESDEILRTVAHLAVPRIADLCTIDLLDPGSGTMRTVEAVAVNPDKERVLRELRERFPLAPFSFEHPASRVIRTGQAALVTQARADMLERVARTPEHLQLLRTVGAVSWMIVPLAARGRIIGAITFTASESGRHYGHDDLQLAEELATASALAIDNARLYDEARESARMRDEVLAFVAHDLRNPLSAIARWNARLEDPGATGDERRRAVNAIRDAAESMSSLITDLMDISRMESGHLRVEPQPVRPEYLLSTARELFEPAAQAKGVELAVEAPELPHVHADPERIHQVLSNLLDNALHVAPAGSTITVRAQAHEEGILFSVSDTGAGIAPADLPHVFDRFWQATHARKTGAGLGLAIARGIVEAHQGRIWVESTLGRGSTFSFVLPLWRGAIREPGAEPMIVPRSTPPEAARAAAPPEQLRVLVVEDHPLTRSGLVQLLNAEPGITVIGQAATGEEAIELAQKLRPGVVIMDLSMPGMGGVEATRRIVSETSDAIVLVLTADEAPATLAAALRAGARGYLRKTVNEGELVASLRAVARGELLIDPSLKEFLRTGLRAPEDNTASAALQELSERERKVLALTAQGYTAVQAGEKLFLSPKTVETYRSRAMRKLGLETRADLVAFAMRIGLLSS